MQTSHREQSPIIEQRVSSNQRTSQPSCEQQEEVVDVRPVSTEKKEVAVPRYTEGLELDQPPFYKLKSMSLLKLLPGKGWAKVAAVNLYMAKCVQLPDQSVLILGGSSD